jgi:hypothetical protein
MWMRGARFVGEDGGKLLEGAGYRRGGKGICLEERSFVVGVLCFLLVRVQLDWRYTDSNPLVRAPESSESLLWIWGCGFAD